MKKTIIFGMNNVYLTKNFHTHTRRCHHAEGTEREYVEEAIKAGLKTLGFSDHTPFFYENGYISSSKMLPEEFEEYYNVVSSLKKEYAKDIDIYIGLEAEYCPKLFGKLFDFVKDRLDYFILGQHCTENDYDGIWVALPFDDENILARYTEQVIEGINTGKFSYIAHPDIVNYKGSEKIFEKYMLKICEEAKRLDIPLELNLLGQITNRNYPCEKFYRIAEQVKNKVILGVDAHTKKMLTDCQNSAKSALDRFSGFNLEITDNIKLLSGKIV